MKRTVISTLILVCSAAMLLSFELPKNWFTAGSKPDAYQMGIDRGSGQHGTNAATIKSIESKISGFGTLMQSCSPKTYLGKKVKMTGMLRTENVKEWAGLWMRVDGDPGKKEPLAFDNMQDRPVSKTTSWQQYEITLDVPPNATNLAYGSLLVGTGQVWFSDIHFEIVGDADGKNMHGNLSTRLPLEAPDNLDFKE